MKKLHLITFLFCCQIIVAQTNDYKVTYKQFLSYGQKLQRDAILYIKENQPTVMHTPMASTVELSDREKFEKPENNDTNLSQSVSFHFVTSNFSYSNFPDTYIMVNQKENKNTSIDFIGTKRGFLVNDDQLKYTWKITNETKKIKNHTCYKATTTFRGNDFEAWFTPEIPINAGPWKWYGLPGLIVEAYDTEKKHIFLLEKLEKLTEEVPFPIKNFKNITLKEYVVELELFHSGHIGELDRDTTVTSNYKRDFIEKIYEWEENK